jgi:hypothetical protein
LIGLLRPSESFFIEKILGFIKYQTIMIGNEADPSPNTVIAEPVPGADHRRTFITAAPAAKAWMDELRAPDSGRPSGSRSVRPSAPAGEQ